MKKNRKKRSEEKEKYKKLKELKERQQKVNEYRDKGRKVKDLVFNEIKEALKKKTKNQDISIERENKGGFSPKA